VSGKKSRHELRPRTRASSAGRPSTPFALALPAFLFLAAFVGAPLGLLALYSFGTIDELTFKVGFGWTFSNYERINDSLYLHALARSFALSAGATVGCLIVGFPVAYLISRTRPTIRTILLLAVLVPFWTSFIIRTYALQTILQDNGPVVRALGGLGFGSPQILYTPMGIALGLLYNYLPLMIVPLFVALERIDATLLDAAQDLGASSLRTFMRVTLPLAMPGIIGGCLLVGIPATGEYVIPVLLGGGKTLMFGNVVANQFINVGDYPFGAALATSFMIVVTAFVLVARGRIRPVEAHA
jgi:spermidine/putrescine transport system permease protein